MKKYEYRTVFYDAKKGLLNLAVDMEGLENKLNDVGSKGWKLCTTVKEDLQPHRLILIFEREVSG